MPGRSLTILLLIIVFYLPSAAQTTEFVYQGQLQNSSAPANGTFEFEFLLYDTAAIGTGTQLGPTLNKSGVLVTNGIFSVMLDFGGQFTGAQRFLEIHVRQAGVGGTFTPLAPRQAISNTPYSVKSLIADTAVNATTAGNATQLGGLAASTYLQTNGNGSQLTNINGANITNNTISVSALSTGVTVTATTNSSLLGSLRWDLLALRNFTVDSPRYVASDGANIWVTSFGSNTVTKMRVTDGTVLGTFAVGTGPTGVVFDGSNIWVANNSSGNVTKLRASDGACVGTCTFAVGTNPKGIVFDGANIWVTSSSGNLTKLLASDGSAQGTFAVGAAGAIAFDGTNIWVTTASGSFVKKLLASDGSLQGTFSVFSNPQSIVFDGANIWVASSTNTNNLAKLRSSDGFNLGSFQAGTFLTGIAFDGTNIWVGNSTSGTVTKIRAGDGVNVGTFSVGNSISSSPLGIAFDGANIWVVNSNTNNITKIPAFP